MAHVQAGEKAVDTTGPLRHVRGDPESAATSLSLDKDIAIGLVGEHARDIDPEVEKRVLRKIDLFLIPAMIVGKFPALSLSHLRRGLDVVSYIYSQFLVTRQEVQLGIAECCPGCKSPRSQTS
jgi:hypothetical protein